MRVLRYYMYISSIGVVYMEDIPLCLGLCYLFDVLGGLLCDTGFGVHVRL